MRAVLSLALIVAACAPKPPPVIVKEPVVIEKTIVIRPPPVAPRGSKAAHAVNVYRHEEQKVPESVGYPGATSEQIREIYRSERAAHKATQHMIDRDGKATKQDQDDAHDAIDALRKAQQAPARNAPAEDKP